MVRTAERRVVQSSPEFRKRLRQLQGKIKATNGKEPSLTELTDEMIKVPAFEDVEKQLLNINVDNVAFRIKLDDKIK